MPRLSLLMIALLTLAAPAAGAEQHRRYLPIVAARYWYTGHLALGDGGQPTNPTLGGHTLRLRGMFGHRVADWGTIFIAAARYDLTSFEVRRGDRATRDTYHAPFLRLGVVQRLAPRWSLLAYSIAGVGSDMEGLSAADLRLTVGAGALYRASSRLRLVFGAMYTSDFYVKLPLPLFTVTYRAGSARLQLRIPKGASAWLIARRWLELGVVIEALNLRYGLHAAGRFADALSALNVTAGPAARLFLQGGFYLRVDGGWNVRYYRAERDGAQIHERLSFAGGFFSASTGYML